MLATNDELTITPQQLNIAVHDCTVTLVSPRTGDHRTFRIKTERKGKLEGKRIISLLTGPNNEANYVGFGFVDVDGVINVWRRYRADDGRSLHERFADIFHRPSHWEGKGVKFMISLNCRRCARKLTHPESITNGYGPECIKKV